MSRFSVPAPETLHQMGLGLEQLLLQYERNEQAPSIAVFTKFPLRQVTVRVENVSDRSSLRCHMIRVRTRPLWTMVKFTILQRPVRMRLSGSSVASRCKALLLQQSTVVHRTCQSISSPPPPPKLPVFPYPCSTRIAS